MDGIQRSPVELQREKDDQEALDHPVKIDGHSLKLRDVFPDAYAAREFRTKLRLLNSKAGGEPDGEAPGIEDQLFKPRKNTQEKNPVGMDGE